MAERTPLSRYMIRRNRIQYPERPIVEEEDAFQKVHNPKHRIHEAALRLVESRRGPFEKFFTEVLLAIEVVGEKQMKCQLLDFLYYTVGRRQKNIEPGSAAEPTRETENPLPDSTPEEVAIKKMFKEWQWVAVFTMHEDAVTRDVQDSLIELLGDIIVVGHDCIEVTINAGTNPKARELAAKLFRSPYALRVVAETLFKCLEKHLKKALSEGSEEVKDSKELILESIALLKEFTEITMKANLSEILNGNSFKVVFLLAIECKHNINVDVKRVDLIQRLTIQLEGESGPVPEIIQIMGLKRKNEAITDPLEVKKAKLEGEQTPVSVEASAATGRTSSEHVKISTRTRESAGDPPRKPKALKWKEDKEGRQERQNTEGERGIEDKEGWQERQNTEGERGIKDNTCLTVQVDDDGVIYEGDEFYTSLGLDNSEKQISSIRMDGHFLYMLVVDLSVKSLNQKTVVVCNLEEYQQASSQQISYHPSRFKLEDQGAHLMEIHKKFIIVAGVDAKTTSEGYVALYCKDNYKYLRRITYPLLKKPRCMCVSGDKCFLINVNNSLITVSISEKALLSATEKTQDPNEKIKISTPTSMVFHRGYLYVLCRRSVYLMNTEGEPLKTLKARPLSALDNGRDMSINSNGLVVIANEVEQKPMIQMLQLEYEDPDTAK